MCRAKDFRFMAQNLAPVYMNDTRVGLQGEPKPKVEKIVIAAGQKPEMVSVFRLKNQQDSEGKPLSLEEFIDRTQETNPVYLKCIEEQKAARAPGGTPPAGGRPQQGRWEEKTPTAEPGSKPGGASPPSPQKPPAPEKPGEE